MNKDHSELLYIMVRRHLQKREKQGYKLTEIPGELNRLRKMEGEPDITLDVARTYLEDLKEAKWLEIAGKLWRVHSKETGPHIAKDYETALVLDAIVKLLEEKKKDSFEIQEVEKYLFVRHPKLKEEFKENHIEKKIIPRLKKAPYIDKEITTGAYTLIKENYYPSYPFGEKHYIDLILKYRFKGL